MIRHLFWRGWRRELAMLLQAITVSLFVDGWWHWLMLGCIFAVIDSAVHGQTPERVSSVVFTRGGDLGEISFTPPIPAPRAEELAAEFGAAFERLRRDGDS